MTKEITTDNMKTIRNVIRVGGRRRAARICFIEYCIICDRPFWKRGPKITCSWECHQARIRFMSKQPARAAVARTARRRWNAENREYRRARDRNSRAMHNNVWLARERRTAMNNRKRRREREHEYYWNNREEKLKQHRAYYAAHREERRIANQKRYYKQAAALRALELLGIDIDEVMENANRNPVNT